MKPMQRKPDVLDSLMSAPMDDDEEAEEGVDSEVAVMSFEDDEEAAAPEEGTPEAKIAGIRSALDELEQMLAGG